VYITLHKAILCISLYTKPYCLYHFTQSHTVYITLHKAIG